MGEKLRLLDLFSGIGGFSLGLERTGGFETVAFCEIDPGCRAVLARHWPSVRQFDDICALSSDDIGEVDAICGGFPCQDISVANVTGEGLDGARSGLWREYARLIRELRPRVVVVENVAALLSRGLGRVLGDLAALGYDAWWDCIPASALDAAHRRDRFWLVAHAGGAGWKGFEPFVCALKRSLATLAVNDNALADARRALDGGFLGVRGDDGVPLKVERDRLKRLGNAVVPQIPELIGRAILAAHSPALAA